jgi:hypothetical protein
MPSALLLCIDRLPKVLAETGKDQVLDLCRSAERISHYRPEDADSGVALRLRMLIRALIVPWTRHPQARPFRQLLLAKGLKLRQDKLAPYLSRIITSGLGMLFFCARFCKDEPRKAGAEICCAVDNDVVLSETMYL